MTDADLDEMIACLLEALAPGLPYRHEPRVHPYTERGRQVDVRHDGRWVEVWECGLAHPGVLAAAGLAGCGGLALGMGLDRMLMLAKDIPDIRLLRSADPRIAGQMLDLAAYRPVSSMPPVTRDLSVAVDADEDDGNPRRPGPRRPRLRRVVRGGGPGAVRHALRRACPPPPRAVSGPGRASRTSWSASCSATWRRR